MFYTRSYLVTVVRTVVDFPADCIECINYVLTRLTPVRRAKQINRYISTSSLSSILFFAIFKMEHQRTVRQTLSQYGPPSPRFSHSSRWRWITVWLMRSGREFPLAGGTRSSDLTAAPLNPPEQKEWGRLTLVNIDLLLPPALPRLLLSTLWCEIRRHIRTHTKTNQTSVFFFGHGVSWR